MTPMVGYRIERTFYIIFWPDRDYSLCNHVQRFVKAKRLLEIGFAASALQATCALQPRFTLHFMEEIGCMERDFSGFKDLQRTMQHR